MSTPSPLGPSPCLAGSASRGRLHSVVACVDLVHDLGDHFRRNAPRGRSAITEVQRCPEVDAREPSLAQPPSHRLTADPEQVTHLVYGKQVLERRLADSARIPAPPLSRREPCAHSLTSHGSR